MDANLFLLTLLKYFIFVFLFIVILWLLRKQKSLKLERRIGRYSLTPLKNKTKNKTLTEEIKTLYKTAIIKLRKPLSKMSFLNNLSKKYSKYTINESDKTIDFISKKLLISFIFIILVIITKIIKLKTFSIFSLIIYFIFGFYLYDIYLIIERKRRNKIIEDQILRAIIIMNNAFKAGKSTLQAVEIASKELNEPISNEFQKIYKDMKYGLSIDTVFERFAKRVEVEEARYVSSSLTVLNQTGGNIIKIFSSIEKTLFDKKKLQEELKNLTASSKLIVKILLIIPIIFTLLIYVLNPTYFAPLLNSTLGILILIVILLMFILYIVILRKITKVKV